MTAPLDARGVLGVEPPKNGLMDCGYELFGWQPAAHHVIWYQWLQKLVNRELPEGRLLIVAPPGHAKTNVGAIAFGSYYVGHNPYDHLLSFSATGGLSLKTSMAVRGVVENSPVWREMFPAVRPDYTRGWSANSWFVQRPLAPGDKDPTFFATSVNSSAVLGSRGDLLIFDDVSTQENTATRYRREKVKEWIEQTAMSRATPDAIMLCIMTRWHTDDMAGYFAREHGFVEVLMPANGYWEHVDNPRLATMDGEPLWPEHMTAENLDRQKRIQGPYKYTAMFQGNPTAVEGAILQESDFGPFYVPHATAAGQRALVEHHRALLPPYDAVVRWDGSVIALTGRYMFADTAFSDKDDADFTVFATWGLGLDRKAYLLDVWRRRISATDLYDEFLAYWHEHRPDLAVIEEKASGIQLAQDLQRKTAIPITTVKPTMSKEERLRAQSHVVRGAFSVPDPEQVDGEWVAEFLAEHAEFPRGSYDDQVDTTSMAAEYLRYQLEFWEHEESDLVYQIPDQVFQRGRQPEPPEQRADLYVANGPSGPVSRWGERPEGFTR